nr:unnamed protein product [Callosobruchus analis]CAI5853674.1 unnamed protein product [Callosobruchus analis]
MCVLGRQRQQLFAWLLTFSNKVR